MQNTAEFDDNISAFRTTLAAASSACGGIVSRVTDHLSGAGFPDESWLRNETGALAAEARSWGQLAGHATAALAAAARPAPQPETVQPPRRPGGLRGLVASLRAIPADLLPDEAESRATDSPPLPVPAVLQDTVGYALSLARDRRGELAAAALVAKDAALSLQSVDGSVDRRRLYLVEELVTALVAQQETILISSRELERSVPRPREPFTAHLVPAGD